MVPKMALAFPSREMGDSDYSLHGIGLDKAASEKDIGVTIDKDLKFRVHMGDKINKANSIMGLICMAFKNLFHLDSYSTSIFTTWSYSILGRVALKW